MSCTRTQIINKAREWVGYNEADGSHKKIIDIYNSQNKLPRGYKLKYTDAWCAGTVSALAIACNATDIIPTEVSCNKLIELAKEMGIWVEADDYDSVLPGDLILYDWNDDGVGDNMGAADHIGIIEYIVGDTMTAIEGNYQNAVGRRPMRKNGKYIRGFITPDYSDDPVNTQKPKGTCSVELWILQKGSKGENVKSLQTLLIGYKYKMKNGCKVYGADGDFGTATENALKAFQKDHDLDADGICGPLTWSALLGV